MELIGGEEGTAFWWPAVMNFVVLPTHNCLTPHEWVNVSPHS